MKNSLMIAAILVLLTSSVLQVYGKSFFPITIGAALITPSVQNNKWVTNGPNLRVNAVVIDPSNRDVLYAGTTGGGIFKSTNGGVSWKNVLSATSINTIAVDPQNTNTIYAGGPGFTGLLKTTNGGASWKSINNNLGILTGVYSIAIDPRNTATVYIGLGLVGIFKSTNGGASWSRTGASSYYVATIAIDPKNTNIIYAGNSAYKTTNGGTTWTPTALSTSTVNALVVDPSNSSIVYAASSSAIYKTTNGGLTWNNLSNSYFGPTKFLSIAIDPITSGTIYAAPMVAARSVYKSMNGGATWIAFDNGLAGVFATSLAIDRTGKRVCLGAGSGVYVLNY